MVKIPVGQPKKFAAVLIIVVLVTAGAYAYFFVYRHNSVNKNLTSAQEATVMKVGRDTCSKDFGNISKLKTDELVAQDAIYVLNYKANCYFGKGEYQHAIDEYQQMYAICPKTNNPASCKASTDYSIDNAKDMIARSKPLQPKQKPYSSAGMKQ
jgi:tetratricopeptide (TPR) repeat protein